MKKLKAKTAAQKRRAKAKMKQKVEELKRGNWVLERLEWIAGPATAIVDADADVRTDADNNTHAENDTIDVDDNSLSAKEEEEEVGTTATIAVKFNKEEGEQQQQQSPRDARSRSHDISIVSWNVLADAYCSRTSHRNLPSKFQRHVFNRKERQHNVRQTLCLLDAKLSSSSEYGDGKDGLLDFIALQEVDPPLEISKCMKQLGYGVVETLSSKDGYVGRVDACGLYYRISQWICLDHETIRLDDLAILRSISISKEEEEKKEKKEKEENEEKTGKGKTLNDDNTKTIQQTTTTDSISELFGGKRSTRERNNGSTSTSNNGSMKGLQRSFVRKNVALLVRLQHISTGRKVVVVVAHLFWNPAYEYVKLCQTHYIAIRAKAFGRHQNNNNNHDNDNEVVVEEEVPIIWCGDFNSKPEGSVHRYLTTGVVNAKAVAPWYNNTVSLHHQQQQTQQQQQKEKQNDNNNNSSNNNTAMDSTADDCQIMTGNLDRLDLSDENTNAIINTKDNNNHHQKSDNNNNALLLFPKVRYMLDYTLNRLCRWLRILGIDAAIETEEEEKERTKDAKITIFRRCREEGRSLVTTASRLLHRKDCPPGTYLLDQKSLLNLDLSLVHLLLSHGVKLEPTKMLSRCVVCNGNIEPVYGATERQEIFQSYCAPDEVNSEVLDVYQCNSCSQGYWWCEKPTSSASRVKIQATKLLELCISGGVPVDDDLGMFFDHVDVEKIKNENKTKNGGDGSCSETISSSLNKEHHQLDVVQWLQTENLINPLKPMASAYALKDTGKESLPFTNVTSDFVGHLDYILYETQAMEVTDLLYVPKTFDELNDLDIPHGHLLPSCDWPSDHLSIGCRLSFIPPTPEDEDESNTLVPFPPLPSFFFLPAPWCAFIDESKIEEVSHSTSSATHIRRLVEAKQSKVKQSKAKQTEFKQPQAYVNPASVLPHGERCPCGCVPNVPSLFEMAELRRQYRLSQKENKN